MKVLAALLLCVGVVVSGCQGSEAKPGEPGGSGGGLTAVTCGDGEFVLETRCVMPCPTYNGSLCELDGTPIQLPPSPLEPDGGPADCGTDCGPMLSTQVALGKSHSCVLEPSGSVRCFGSDEFGQLGGSAPGEPIRDLEAVQIAAGDDHTCARLAGGTVRCWGRNDLGQLGDGSEMPHSGPVEVIGLSGVAEISLATEVSYARLQDGTVMYWGVSWGDRRFWTSSPAPNGLRDAVAINAGRHNCCARVADGTIRCSGNHDWSSAGSDPETPVQLGDAALKDAKKIACSGASGCVVLTSDERVVAWGFNRNGIPGQGYFDDDWLNAAYVPDLSGVVDVVAGFEHACALRGQGEVWCWGRDRRGELGGMGDSAKPALLGSAATASRLLTSAGASSTCVELQDGSLECWGAADAGQIGAAPLVLGLVE